MPTSELRTDTLIQDALKKSKSARCYPLGPFYADIHTRKKGLTKEYLAKSQF